MIAVLFRAPLKTARKIVEKIFGRESWVEKQYAIYGKEIKVTTSKDEFSVSVPFVDLSP